MESSMSSLSMELPGASDGKYTEVKLCNHLQKGKNGAAGKKIVTENAYYLASLTGEHGEHAH